MLRTLMPDGVFATFEYTYDGHGRVAQRIRQMARMQKSRETYSYDDYGNVTDQHDEGTERDARIDDEGALVMAPESSNESWTRYEYRYDDRGNWVERVSLRRMAPEESFHRLAIERRTIAYF
jgi:YD repeat-containing protein